MVAERLMARSPMDRFMQNMIGGRSMFPGFDDREGFFGNVGMGSTLFERMVSHQETGQGNQPNVIIRHVFTSGPGQQTVIMYTTNQMNNNEW